MNLDRLNEIRSQWMDSTSEELLKELDRLQHELDDSVTEFCSKITSMARDIGKLRIEKLDMKQHAEEWEEQYLVLKDILEMLYNAQFHGPLHWGEMFKLKVKGLLGK